MKNLGIVGLINFSDWDLPEFQEVGGINSVVKSIIYHLEGDKIVLYGFTSDKSKILIEERISDKIVVYPIVYVPRNSKIPIRVYGFLFGWRLLKTLRRHNINAVYSHSEELAFWVPSKGIRLVHHIHTFVNVLQVSGRRFSKNKVLQRLWSNLRDRIIKRSAKIVAVNADIVEMGDRLIGNQRIIQLPNFIDFNHFRYREESTVMRQKMGLNNFKILLYVGRISRVKGLELFVDALHNLNNVDETRWMGMIIGNGEYEMTLKEYIIAKRMDNGIIFKGAINDPETLSQFYSLADVFLITSVSESVPLTLLESLSCGTPVVATDVGICSEILDRNNGFVLSGRDSGKFSKSIMQATTFKTTRSLLLDSYKYSVKYASSLLNEAFWS